MTVLYIVSWRLFLLVFVIAVLLFWVLWGEWNFVPVMSS